jgi:hypothetical protein
MTRYARLNPLKLITLFMVPLLFLLMAEGIDQLLRLFSHSQFHLIGPILILILFFYPLLEAVGYLEKPKVKEEIRPSLNMSMITGKRVILFMYIMEPSGPSNIMRNSLAFRKAIIF